MRLTKPIFLLLLLAGFFFSAFTAANPDVTGKLKQLIDLGEYQEAYTYAGSHIDAMGGDEIFDHYFAQAAFEAGYYSEAAFALERVFINDPTDFAAKERFVETYIQLGRFDIAAETIRHFKREARTASETARLNELSKMVEKAKYRLRSQYYLLMGFGVDSNINEATDDNSVAVFGAPVVIDPNGQARSDAFLRASLLGNFIKPLKGDKSVFLNAHLGHKENLDDKDFDKTNLDLSLGTTFKFKGKPITLTLNYNRMNMDENEFRTSAGFGAEYFHWKKPTFTISYFLRGGRIHYHDEGRRDVDVALAGVRWRYAPKNSYAVVNTKVYIGFEDNRDAEANFQGNKFFGFASKAVWDWGKSYRPFLMAGYQRRVYDDTLAPFGRRQDDHLFMFNTGYEWIATKNMTVHLQYSFKRNESDLELYDFTKHVYEIGFVYKFK